MFSDSLNNLKSITVLTNEKDLVSIKSILKFLKERYSELLIVQFRAGLIGDNTIISFKVNSEYYPIVLEKLAFNDIQIIMKDKEEANFIENKKEQKRRKLRAQGWSEISSNKKQITIEELKRFSDEGKIKEIILEAKGGIRSSLEITEKARKLLSATVKIAIKNLINYAEEKLGKRPDAIDQLILIATDKDLKLLRKIDETNEAGLAAIQISLTHQNYYEYLIKIANNTKLNNFINIKAANSLAELYLRNSDEEIQLPDVIKDINTRWLRIAFESAKKNLSYEEIEKFEHFVEFIEESRRAA
jgi:hypothetical protein